MQSKRARAHRKKWLKDHIKQFPKATRDSFTNDIMNDFAEKKSRGLEYIVDSFSKMPKSVQSTAKAGDVVDFLKDVDNVHLLVGLPHQLEDLPKQIRDNLSFEDVKALLQKQGAYGKMLSVSHWLESFPGIAETLTAEEFMDLALDKTSNEVFVDKILFSLPKYLSDRFTEEQKEKLANDSVALWDLHRTVIPAVKELPTKVRKTATADQLMGLLNFGREDKRYNLNANVLAGIVGNLNRFPKQLQEQFTMEDLITLISKHDDFEKLAQSYSGMPQERREEWEKELKPKDGKDFVFKLVNGGYSNLFSNDKRLQEQTQDIPVKGWLKLKGNKEFEKGIRSALQNFKEFHDFTGAPLTLEILKELIQHADWLHASHHLYDSLRDVSGERLAEWMKAAGVKDKKELFYKMEDSRFFETFRHDGDLKALWGKISVKDLLDNYQEGYGGMTVDWRLMYFENLNRFGPNLMSKLIDVHGFENTLKNCSDFSNLFTDLGDETSTAIVKLLDKKPARSMNWIRGISEALSVSKATKPAIERLLLEKAGKGKKEVQNIPRAAQVINIYSDLMEKQAKIDYNQPLSRTIKQLQEELRNGVQKKFDMTDAEAKKFLAKKRWDKASLNLARISNRLIKHYGQHKWVIEKGLVQRMLKEYANLRGLEDWKYSELDTLMKNEGLSKEAAEEWRKTSHTTVLPTEEELKAFPVDSLLAQLEGCKQHLVSPTPELGELEVRIRAEDGKGAQSMVSSLILRLRDGGQELAANHLAQVSRIINELNVKPKSYVMSDAFHPAQYYNIGERFGTCQSWSSSDIHNRGLISFAADATKKVIGIYDERGRLQARGALHLIKIGNNWALALDRVYSSRSGQHDLIHKFAKKKAKEMGFKLHDGLPEKARLFGKAPSTYCDSRGGFNKQEIVK